MTPRYTSWRGHALQYRRCNINVPRLPYVTCVQSRLDICPAQPTWPLRASVSQDSCSTDDDSKPDAWKVQDAKEIIGIALPTLGTVSSLQLAALGPNTALFNLVFQVFSFCGVATTNVIANNSLTKPGLSDAQRQQREDTCSRILCYAGIVAVVLGCFATTGMATLGAPLLQLLGASPAMMQPGLEYLVVRCLASPAVLVCAVLNGAFVGLQDAVTPLKVCLVAGVLNLLGDVALIVGLGWGIRGAAVATTISQYAALGYALWVTQRGRKKHIAIPLRWWGLPCIQDLQPFAAVAGSLMSRTLFGMVAYTLMTATATRFGTIPAAAHQVALQVYWVISFGADAMSVAAQTLIARDIGQPVKVRRFAYVMLRLSALLGLLLATSAGVVLSLAQHIFTKDVAVLAAAKPLLPQIFTAEILCAFTLMFDGFAIGTGTVGHLPVANFLALCVMSVGCRMATGLDHVYWSLVAFMSTRLATHLAFLVWGTRRKSAFFFGLDDEGGGKVV